MRTIKLSVTALAMLAAGCQKVDSDEIEVRTDGTEAVHASHEVSALPSTSVTGRTEFPIDTVPISHAPLGKFPFFAWPANYVPQNPPRKLDFGHFLFWTGKEFKDVEGQTFLVTLMNAPDKQFSSHELKRNMRTFFQQAGGVKIAEEKIPNEALKAIPSTVIQEILQGFGDPYNDPVETWVIRRPGDTIWIHYSTNSSQGSLAVVQTKPFVPTATLLPADRLKADLDKTGKAVIHVNFATDQTQIVPSSGAQMDAVIGLLKGDPKLKIAINGYTDDTGSAAHNVALSDGRAQAVQAALIAAGIKSDRLQAKGYGRISPVSSNTDEAGKAANRRVELVKL